MADRPHNARKAQRQQETEYRAGDSHDDFVESGNSWQFRTVQIRFAFNNVHRRKLRQRDESSERQRAERILNAVDCLLPERLAEPDAEFLNVKSSPARRQKMSQLMHHNEQIKQDQDLEQDEDDARDVQ